jgi:hypothetical protein
MWPWQQKIKINNKHNITLNKTKHL